MKSISRFTIALLALIFSHTMCAKKIEVTNATGEVLEYITATFSFDGILATVSKYRVLNTTVILDSDMANTGKKFKNEVKLQRLEAAGMGMTGPKFRISFGETHVINPDTTKFDVVKEGGWLMPHYVIKAVN